MKKAGNDGNNDSDDNIFMQWEKHVVKSTKAENTTKLRTMKLILNVSKIQEQQ